MIGPIGSPLVVLLALARPLAAQDERWQVTLDDNRYVWDIRLVGLEGDSLAVRQSDSLVHVPVAHITELRLIRKSEMQLGDNGAGRRDERAGRRRRRGVRSRALDFADRMRTVQKILLMHPAGP